MARILTGSSSHNGSFAKAQSSSSPWGRRSDRHGDRSTVSCRLGWVGVLQSEVKKRGVRIRPYVEFWNSRIHNSYLQKYDVYLSAFSSLFKSTEYVLSATSLNTIQCTTLDKAIHKKLFHKLESTNIYPYHMQYTVYDPAKLVYVPVRTL